MGRNYLAGRRRKHRPRRRWLQTSAACSNGWPPFGRLRHCDPRRRLGRSDPLARLPLRFIETHRGRFRREVQPRRQLWFLNEKSGFSFRSPAFCSVSRGQRRLGEKEYRAPLVTQGVALRVRTQAAAINAAFFTGDILGFLHPRTREACIRARNAIGNRLLLRARGHGSLPFRLGLTLVCAGRGTRASGPNDLSCRRARGATESLCLPVIGSWTGVLDTVGYQGALEGRTPRAARIVLFYRNESSPVPTKASWRRLQRPMSARELAQVIRQTEAKNGQDRRLLADVTDRSSKALHEMRRLGVVVEHDRCGTFFWSLPK